MNENKPTGFLIFTVFAIACILIACVSVIVFGDSCQSLSCGTIKGETVVANEEYIWTEDDEIGRLIREAELPKMDITDCTTLECYKSHPDYTYDPAIEKQKIVANVISKEVKRDNYTIRVGLEGRMKPVPNLYGETTDDRAFEWLSESGLHFTKDTWRAYGDKYKIDFTVPICIAWSDSHLGKALKSKNNIGNIGNNDRGHTKEFDSLEAGIEAIFWSLAKGKYMSGHNTIGTLSGEGRKRLGLPGCSEEKDYRKKCYASSMGNWSTNTTNCLSAIHNKEIREDYQFRI